MMNLNKSITLITLVCFLSSSLLSPVVHAAQAPSPGQMDFKEAAGILALPPSIGKITRSREYGPGPHVAIIQDLHCNGEVQRTISRILETLDAQNGLRQVFVEGAAGPVDTSWVERVGNPAVRNDIAGVLVDAGRLTGAEYYAMVHKKPPLLAGLEDARLHRANIIRLGAILELQPELDEDISRLSEEMSFLEAKYLNHSNNRLGALIAGYHANRVPAEKYYAKLFRYAEKINRRGASRNPIIAVTPVHYPNITGYLAAQKAGKRLRNKRVGYQLRAFINDLKSRMSYADYNALLRQTQNFARLDQGYHTLARHFFARPVSGAPAAYDRRYPDLARFFEWLEAGAAVNPLALIDEERRLIEALRVGFSDNIAELEVSFLADFFGNFADYLHAGLSADNYDYFNRRFGTFRRLWAKYVFVNRLEEVSDVFPLLDDYYQANCARNTCFLERMEQSSTGGLRARGDGEIIPLVVGGFHAQGIARILEQNKISYSVITPNVAGEIEPSAELYRALARRQANNLALAGQSAGIRAAETGRRAQATALNSQSLALELGSADVQVTRAEREIIVLVLAGESVTLRLGENGQFTLQAGAPETIALAVNKSISRAALEAAVNSALKTVRVLMELANPAASAAVMYELVKIFGQMEGKINFSSNGLIRQIVQSEAVQGVIQDHEGLSPEEVARMFEPVQDLVMHHAFNEDELTRIAQINPLVSACLVAGLGEFLAPRLSRGPADAHAVSKDTRPLMVGSLFKKAYAAFPRITAGITAPAIENGFIFWPAYISYHAGLAAGPVVGAALALSWITISSAILAFGFHRTVIVGSSEERIPATIAERTTIFLSLIGMGVGSFAAAYLFAAGAVPFQNLVTALEPARVWLLPAANGYLAGTAVHGLLNLYRRARGGILLMGNTVSAEKVTIDDISSAVQGIETRRLFVTEDVDALDAALAGESGRTGAPYIRLTIHNQEDLDTLMTRVRITAEGRLHVRPGALPELLTGETDNAILLLDFSGSASHLIEQFNSLFNDEPYFGEYKLPDRGAHVRIIGAVSEQQYLQSDSTFRSRFKRVDRVQIVYRDPVLDIRTADDDTPAVVVDTYGSPLFRDRLLGGLDGTEGAIAEAIRRNIPLVLEGASWETKELVYFIRQLLLRRVVELNGETVALPADFQILRRDRDYGKGVSGKRIVAAGEGDLSGADAWIINEENQDILQSRTKVEGGSLKRLPGILDGGAVRIRIQGNPSAWVWHSVMHAAAAVEIEIDDPDAIPAEYRSLRSPAARKRADGTSGKTWEEAAGDRVIYLEGDDAGFLKAFVRNEIPGRILYVPVTPRTSIAQFTASIRSSSPGVYESRLSEVMEALQRGETVLVTDVDCNPALLSALAPALGAHPYLVVNGERLPLTSGKLIITANSAKAHPGNVATRVSLDNTDDVMRRLLGISTEDFNKLNDLRTRMDSIPAPPSPNLYPPHPPFSFDRCALLQEHYRLHQNWLRAVEDVIIPLYASVPEAAAYIRTMARLTFDQDEEGRQNNSIHGFKLFGILNRLAQPRTWSSAVWQLADTLSIDLLDSCEIGYDFAHPQSLVLEQKIKAALYADASGDAKEMYRARFGAESASVPAPIIDHKIRTGYESAEQVADGVRSALISFKAVFLRGPPGVGKSYVAERLAKDLGFSPAQVVGPITAGMDTGEEAIVGGEAYRDGRMELREGPVARWIPADRERERRLIIVDEANLTAPAFWNFLEAFFNKNADDRYVWVNGERRYFHEGDRIIFTGNQESMEGRKFIDLIERHCIVKSFPEQDEGFLHARLSEYVYANRQDRERLLDTMMALHQLFARANPAVSRSLRDLQEFAARVNQLLPSNWNMEDAAVIAWHVYAGSFSAEEQEALKHVIFKLTGVWLSPLLDKRAEDVGQAYGAQFAGAGITLTPAAARMVDEVSAFLAIRRTRIEGRSRLQGKTGMINMGASGRGKDAVLVQALKAMGMTDAKDAAPGTPATRLYYHLNASLRTDDVIAVIEKAQREGSIVIISEMNLLPSAFIEGRLNDVLTGNADPGFALFATENPEQFGGREKHSTALLSRVIFNQISDYPQQELADIAREHARQRSRETGTGLPSEEAVKYLVNAHCWIRRQIPNINFQPTTRDLINAIDRLMSGEDRRGTVEAVYGSFYLRKIAAETGRELPHDTTLEQFTETKPVDNAEVLRLIGTYISRYPVTLQWDAETEHGGYQQFERDALLITLNTKNPTGYNRKAMDHEAGHALFTRDIGGLTPRDIEGQSYHLLYIWLEDLRMEHAVRQWFPSCELDGVNDMEAAFAGSVKTLDVTHITTSTEQDQFKYILSCYAKGLITEQEVHLLGEVLDGIAPINSAQLALKHLASAKGIYDSIPFSLDEEEVQIQQFRMLSLLESMREDYALIDAFRRPGRDDEGASEDVQLQEAMAATARMNDEPLVPESAGKQTILPHIDADPSARVAAAKEALRQKTAAVRRATIEDVNRELDLMDSDLPLADMGRLLEMREQLTNPAYAHSIKLPADYLRDETINRRLKIMLHKVGKTIQKMQAHYDADTTSLADANQEETVSFDGPLSKLFMKLLRGAGTAVSARYKPTAVAHREGARGAVPKRKPVSVRPVTPSAQPVDLPSIESVPREPSMENISRQFSGLIEKATRNLFRWAFSFDRIYGPEGVLLDERRLAVTGNIAEALYRTGGTPENFPKEIVLRAEPDMRWNIVATELLHYLLNKGCTFTVYTSATSYIEHIGTIAGLKRVCNAAQGDIDVTAIEKDLRTRKRPENYAVYSLPELQSLIEHAYLFGALKNRSSSTPDDMNAERSLDDQVELARSFLRQYNIPQDRIFVDGDIFRLDLHDVPLSDISPLSVLTRLTELNLSETDVSDISPLAGMTHLLDLFLSGTLVNDISPLAGLTSLRELDLVGTAVSDIGPLGGLTSLRRLYLSRTSVEDISSLAGLENLESLHLKDCDVSDYRPLLGLRKLRYLSISGKKLIAADSGADSDEWVYALFRDHVNQEGLTIVSAAVTVNKTNFEKYCVEHPAFVTQQPVTVQELNVDEQRRIINNFLEKSGVKGLYCFPLLNDHLQLDIATSQRIKNIKKLQGLTRVSLLKLLNAHVSIIEALPAFPNVRNLIIAGVMYSDIRPFTVLKHLKTVALHNTSITDISALKDCADLIFVELEDTNVSDKMVYELFRDHPNRENLVVEKVVKENRIKFTYANYLKYCNDHPEFKVPAAGQDVSHIPLAAQIIRVLVNPDAVIEWVRERLTDDGDTDGLAALEQAQLPKRAIRGPLHDSTTIKEARRAAESAAETVLPPSIPLSKVIVDELNTALAARGEAPVGIFIAEDAAQMNNAVMDTASYTPIIITGAANVDVDFDQSKNFGIRSGGQSVLYRIDGGVLHIYVEAIGQEFADAAAEIIRALSGTPSVNADPRAVSIVERAAGKDLDTRSLAVFDYTGHLQVMLPDTPVVPGEFAAVGIGPILNVNRAHRNAQVPEIGIQRAWTADLTAAAQTARLNNSLVIPVNNIDDLPAETDISRLALAGARMYILYEGDNRSVAGALLAAAKDRGAHGFYSPNISPAGAQTKETEFVVAGPATGSDGARMFVELHLYKDDYAQQINELKRIEAPVVRVTIGKNTAGDTANRIEAMRNIPYGSTVIFQADDVKENSNLGDVIDTALSGGINVLFPRILPRTAAEKEAYQRRVAAEIDFGTEALDSESLIEAINSEQIVFENQHPIVAAARLHLGDVEDPRLKVIFKKALASRLVARAVLTKNGKPLGLEDSTLEQILADALEISGGAFNDYHVAGDMDLATSEAVMRRAIAAWQRSAEKMIDRPAAAEIAGMIIALGEQRMNFNHLLPKETSDMVNIKAILQAA